MVRGWLAARQVEPRSLLRLFVTGIDSSERAGWATASLLMSLRNAVLIGALGLDLMIGVSALIEGHGRRWELPFLALIGVAIVVDGACLAGRVPAWNSVWTTFLVSTTAACVAQTPNDLLLFISMWAVHLATAMPAGLIRGPAAFVAHAIGCFGYSIAMAIVHPEWGWVIPQDQLIAGYGIFLLTRAGLAVLAEVAERFDLQSAADDERFVQIEQRRMHGRVVAEDARVLHDTAINTLAAIASGGAGIRDRALVRDRCAMDRGVLSALRAGVRAAAHGSADAAFAGVHLAGIAVERTGLDDAELAQLWSTYPLQTRKALEGASREVVLNAAKHAGVPAVRLDVRRAGDGLEVTISDDGVGFDAGATDLRGLQRSVLDRSAEAGIDVRISSTPGAGTTVVLRLAGDPGANVDDEGDREALARIVGQIRRGAVWLWAVAVLVVGVFLELVTAPGRLTPTYGALALGAVGVVLVWSTRRSESVTMRWMVSVTLVVIVVAAFVLAARTWDFGRVDPVFWQVLVNTGSVVLLKNVGGRSAMRVGLLAPLVTSVVLAAIGWSTSITGSLILVAGAGIASLFVIGWGLFDHALGAIGRQLALNQRRLVRARLDDDLRIRAEELRASWHEAGLDRVDALLGGLASGFLDPADERVRRECGAEEAYLRKIIQIEPDLVRLMPWLLRAFGAARERGVELAIRSGSVEPTSEQTADEMGAMILDVVRRAASGDRVTATLFVLGSGTLSFMVVTPHPLLAGSSEPLAWTAQSVTTVGGNDIFEAKIPA